MLSRKFIKAKDEVARLYAHTPSPIFRRKFNIDEKITAIRITVGTAGFYKLFLNGKEITKGHMAPYIANPTHYVFYDSYDVCDGLSEGENVIAVLLGNGFQNPSGAVNWFFNEADWVSPLSFAISVEDISRGGEDLLFEADESFLCTDSPYEYDDIRMGVVYDARRERTDILLPSFDDSHLAHAKTADTPKGEARLCIADPIKPRYEIKPRKIDFVGDGLFMPRECENGSEFLEESAYHNAYLYDFGENNAGVIRLNLNAKAGRRITLRFGELLVDGKFQLRNLSSVKTEDIFRAYIDYNQRIVYTTREGENLFTPDFTYFGFRYVLVEGIDESEATDELLTYVVLSSSVERKTTFSSSSEIANKLFDATIRSDYSNLFYIPTDCPHREKNGWTGDASVSAEQFMLNLGAENTLKEWMRCVSKAQTDDGVIPGVVPTAGWCYTGLRGPLWDAVCVNIPYYVYKYSADTEILRESSDMIYKYLLNIEAMRDGCGIVDYGLTDWNQPDRPSSKPDAPRSVTDTAQCVEIARLAEEIYRIIGDVERASYAKRLYLSLREAFRENLIDFGTMTVLGSCQTSQTLGIAFGIFEENELPQAKKMLLKFIEEKDCHIATGMLGIRYIFHVLCDMGEAELAMKMICRTDRIGYGFWIKSGYDTLWETFARPEGPHVSKNHHYFGDISSIFVQRIAGIQPNPQANDLSEFVISPELSCGLDFAKATYESIHGQVSSHWSKLDGESFIIEISAPSEVHGKIKLPCGYIFKDGESVKPISSGRYEIKKKECRI